ncbi:MAG: hypothetical protein JST00_21895 [Deltaproteobacteria bacterium]|nr:hypothetical protein [Deltaproteobacteria bacterium]
MVTGAMPRVTDWSPRGIVPLELWDARVDGRTLFERRSEPTFYESLVRALPSSAREVALLGGGLDLARAESAFRSSAFELVLAENDPLFAARAVAEEVGGVVVDAGQTSVKAATASKAARIERGGRDRLASLVVEAIDAVEAVDGAEGDLDLLLAVPCELEGSGAAITLGPCSYPIEGDARRLVEAIDRGARRRLRSVRLVNDAVMAAHAARRRHRVERSLLVLTIGHGVGAALVEASP